MTSLFVYFIYFFFSVCKDQHIIRALSATDSKVYVMKLTKDLQRKVLSLKKKIKTVEMWKLNAGRGKLVRNHFAGATKSHLKTFKISSWSGRSNGFSVVGYINKIPCHLIIDIGMNVPVSKKDLIEKMGEKFIWPSLPSSFWLEMMLKFMHKSKSHLKMSLIILSHM